MEGECTKYYALCLDRGIQTNPIMVNDPVSTSCRDGVIVAASSCSLSRCCDQDGLFCTDSKGVQVDGMCTSYFRECTDGIASPVTCVSPGTKCLNGKIVASSDCSSACCTWSGIKCTNAYGQERTTVCTGYYVKCENGEVTSPIAVPEGNSCLNREIVSDNLCPGNICYGKKFLCSDDKGDLVTNACTEYIYLCEGFDELKITGEKTSQERVMKLSDDVRCYNDQIVDASVCTASQCTDGTLLCTDVNGVAQTDICTGYYRQCSDGEYNSVEAVPKGTSCRNGEILLASDCSGSCVEGTICTNSYGNLETNVCTKYYRECSNGVYGSLQNTAAGMSCLNGEMIAESQCSDVDYECDFEGIRCSTSDGTLITDRCSDYYVQCEFGMYSEPRKTADGTMCFNNEQVPSSSCTTSCDWEGVKCSNLNGDIITNTCTNYFVECDNGMQTTPVPVADGSKCLNGELVPKNTCLTPVCTEDQLVCTDSEGVVDTTACTDYFTVCDNGVYGEVQGVAYGTKCLKGTIVPTSSCTGVACEWEGIRCSDADGTIYTDMCTTHFVQCNDGSLTAPLPVANNTRCYNGVLIATDNCPYEYCDFDGLKCSDANGNIYYDQCTSFFVECSDGQLTQPMPVADGTRCSNGAIVDASACSTAECNFEGIRCSNANGDVFETTCTDYFEECDNGAYSVPRPVADGTKCYNGTIIDAGQCASPICDFDGIECVDVNGVVYSGTCTAYYRVCEHGQYSAIRDMPAGSRCLKGEAVPVSKCTGYQCNWEGEQCVDASGVIITNACTDYYAECDNGAQTAPRPVASGQKCLNGVLVNAGACDSAQCSFEGIQCTNADGTIVSDSCTSYYVQCDDGIISSPHPVADGTRCLKQSIVSASQCDASRCVDSSIVCANANGEIFTNQCTEYYLECDQGVYTAPRAVADGTRCYNGTQVSTDQCTGQECTNGNMRCSDASGAINDNTCTSYFVECNNGYYAHPMPVANGTYCLKGEMVLPFACSQGTCDFTGIKCTDEAGIIFDTTCTDYFVECDNGEYTNPMKVASGTKCIGGNVVLSSTCPGSQCSFDGIHCADASSNYVTGRCTDYYVECVNGAQSKLMPVANGTRCLNNELVLSSACNQPECTFTEPRCVDETGALVTGKCTTRYQECVNGVVNTMVVDSGKACLNNAIVEESACSSVECDFDGFICSDANGSLISDACTEYFVTCVNNKYSQPVAVASGTRCYNQNIISASDEVCSSSTTCEFDGIRCSNEDGELVTGRCSGYFVQCNNGKYTAPKKTAVGTMCYNNEQVLNSECAGMECSFSGMICVDDVDDFVSNTCTTRYAICTDGVIQIKSVESGKACYNSQIIAGDSSSCTVTLEVHESKVKGIRGRK